MEKIGIQTVQNVEIEHNIASFGDRIIAHFLDYIFSLYLEEVGTFYLLHNLRFFVCLF